MKNLKLPKTKEKLNEVDLIDNDKINKLNTILDFYKDSYNEEINKKKIIDAKALYMLLITIIFVFLSLIKINMLELNIGWNEISGGRIAVRIIFWVLIFSEIVLCFISIIKYIRVLNSKRFLKLDFKNFVVENLKNIKYEDVLNSTIKSYKNGADKNFVLNEKITKKYNSATVLTVISMFLLIAIYIFAFFVK